MRKEPTWIEIRNARLKSDYERMLALTDHNDLIAIERADGKPPETYTLRYNCRGVVGMERARPVFGELHRVRIFLPAEYPARPPQMRWLTPFFHPNVNAEGTVVCVDKWYPSKFLDDLTIMLGRMIQYKNYSETSALRADAALWAMQNKDRLPVDDRPLRPGSSRPVDVGEFEIRLL